jgi:hypothetical protein
MRPVIVALVVITTWLLIQSARGSRQVWSTSITPLQKLETKDVSTPVNERKSFYITTSARMTPYLGQPQLLSAPRSVRHQQESSTDRLSTVGPPQVATQSRRSGEFSRARNVSIGAGYVRANDPSTALREMSRPVYAAVPTAGPNLSDEDPSDAYDDTMVGYLSAQDMLGSATRRNAPPPSAFSNPKAISNQTSISSTRSYPYPFPTIPPSQPQSGSPSHAPSLTNQSPLQTQPPDRNYPPTPLQPNQRSNGSLPADPVPAPGELFRARENKNRQTTATAFSLSPYYAGQEDNDDAMSIASRYSTTTRMTKVNPAHSGTAPAPVPVFPPPPPPPAVGPPPSVPMRSPRRQSLSHSDARGVYGRQGYARP